MSSLKRRDLRLRPGVAVAARGRGPGSIRRWRPAGPSSVRPPFEQRAVVLDRALQRLPGEVQPVELGIALLELGEDAQGLGVVVEAAIAASSRACSASSPAWPNGVWPRSWASATASPRSSSSRSVRQMRARDLRHLERMGEPRAVVIALVIDEDLRLVLQPAERRRMDDAVAVALERAARRRLRLGVQAAAALPRQGGIGRQRLASPQLVSHDPRTSARRGFTLSA